MAQISYFIPKKLTLARFELNIGSSEPLQDLQSFLGLAGYYRQYIPDFSTIAKPLSKLTSKETEWAWTEECAKAFQTLKDKLVEARC